jgi:hypothetical protein
MSSNTTRISDLPQQQQENVTMTIPSFMEPVKTRNEPTSTTAPTYQPMMDIHPNPYGVPKPNSPPNFSSNPSYEPEQQHYLPSRDIPRETAGYTQDEQIKVNYIPQPKLTNHDFISEQERYTKENWEERRQKKHRLSKLDFLVNEFQTPLFIAILFFLFQLPAFNSFLYKYFSFLSIYGSDGSLNGYGFVFKSFVFGFFYYFSLKFIDYFSEP